MTPIIVALRDILISKIPFFLKKLVKSAYNPILLAAELSPGLAERYCRAAYSNMRLYNAFSVQSPYYLFSRLLGLFVDNSHSMGSSAKTPSMLSIVIMAAHFGL